MPRLEVELPHEVLLAEVQVDGAVVHGRVRALALDDAEQRAVLDVDDGERVGRRRAERDPRGRVVAARPGPAARRLLQLRELGCALERLVAERGAVGVVDRRLERRRADMAVEHARVRVVEDRRLDTARRAASRARA